MKKENILSKDLSMQVNNVYYMAEKAAILLQDLGEYFAYTPTESEDDKLAVLNMHYIIGVKRSIIKDYMMDMSDSLYAIRDDLEKLSAIISKGADTV